MPSADTDHFDRSGTNGPKMQDPLIRFEMVERLGYGSSGSSVSKARDRFDDMKTVAIKKIPLSTLAYAFGDRSSNATQFDVDYFVGCLADHNRGSDYDGNDDSTNLINVNTESSFTALMNENDIIMQTGMQAGTRVPSTMIAKQARNGDRIVKCLGCYQTDSELWLSLEYCGGGSVADLIRLSEGPLTESEIGWIMSQVLLGLAFLHSKDHIHGDIKASNILLTLDGHVKLGGTGSVMSHKEGAGERRRRRRSLTMTELPASWLAPESNSSSPMTPNSPEVDSRMAHSISSS
ncbi:hypothetical protein BGZ65_008426, partial [Modicella reniformis]